MNLLLLLLGIILFMVGGKAKVPGLIVILLGVAL